MLALTITSTAMERRAAECPAGVALGDLGPEA